MANKIVVEKQDWSDEKNRFKYAADLEAGNILFFSEIPFEISNEERKALTQGSFDFQMQESSSKKLDEFLSSLLSPYAGEWKEGEVQEFCRQNSALTIDACSSRPLHGGRVLRFFMNTSFSESQKWMTSLSFQELLLQFGGKEVPFPEPPSYSMFHRFVRKTRKAASELGIKLSLRSPYDSFMLNLKSFMRTNQDFQKETRKDFWEFPPLSCWAFFTDQVSYGTLTCSQVLEKSYIIPQRVLLFPEKSPLGVLERVTRGNMVVLEYAKL